MRVYLDNAATTPMDKEVLDAMTPYMLEQFGNPSSIHSHGREARAAIEKARKTIAALLHTSPAEIFFTSGGTEADNTAIRCCVETMQLKHAITSSIEHHAVLHTLEAMAKKDLVQLHLVRLDERGHVDVVHLEQLLQTYPRALVSLMQANNEIGNLTDIQLISELCCRYNAFFHSDTVQTVGHYRHNLQKLKANFITGAAHKFHGPKGAGFLYISSGCKVAPFIFGGSQERNMRGGTENVYGIVGLAKALEIAYRDMDEHRAYIQNLKSYLINRLKENIEDVSFNGDSANAERSLYTVLNVSLPPAEINDMLLFNLDIHKISASGGSACSSGSNVGSHVLQALNCNSDRVAVRFSFSKYNTFEELDYVVNTLAQLYNKKTQVA